MGRTHIHFAKGEYGSANVISGNSLSLSLCVCVCVCVNSPSLCVFSRSVRAYLCFRFRWVVFALSLCCLFSSLSALSLSFLTVMIKKQEQSV